MSRPCCDRAATWSVIASRGIHHALLHSHPNARARVRAPRPRDRRRGDGRARDVLPCAAAVNADRRFAILMNPASAGGKPLRVLPGLQRELDAAGAEHRVVETRDMAHATHAAREASGRGEVVVALGGDGLVGKLAGALRDSDSARASCRAAAATTSRARSAYLKTSPGATRVLLDGVRKALDLGEANGKPFACIASMGYDSEANRIANEAKLVRGNLVYAYAGDPRADGVEARPLHGATRRPRAPLRGLHGRGREHRLLRRRHEHGAWRRSLRRSARGRDHDRAGAKAPVPRRTCRRCSRARTSSEDSVSVAARRRGARSPPTGPSTCTPTGTRSRPCRPRSGWCAAG